MISLLLLNHRPAPTVAVQPTVSIRRWQIVETTLGEELLAGMLPGGYTWRVTTPITSFSASTRCITTTSGRVYELVGPSAVDDLDLLVIDANFALNYVGPAEDKSGVYAQAMAGAVN